MVTPEEVSARLAKARQPIKTMEETEKAPVEEETPIENEEDETSDEEGSTIDEDEAED